MANITFNQIDVKRKKILLVDDDSHVVRLMADMIGGFGYRVVGIIDSMEAFDLFAHNPNEYDLVITDQTMPKLSGIELAQRIFQIRPNMPIIMCSGYGTLSLAAYILA